MCPQLGVKALTYNDLIQAQKEISAHNQQLREQTEQLQKDNRELRSQSLQLVGAWPRGTGKPSFRPRQAGMTGCLRGPVFFLRMGFPGPPPPPGSGSFLEP